MPRVEGFVVGCEEGERLNLVVEEAECFDVGEVLPEGRVDSVGVDGVALDGGEGESEDEKEVETAEEDEGVVCFLEHGGKGNCHYAR